MTDIVLLAMFIGLALYGYYLVSKLDGFLGKVKIRRDDAAGAGLSVATSSAEAVPAVIRSFKELRQRDADTPCHLAVGSRENTAHLFETGKVDMLIAPEEAGDPDAVEVILLAPQSTELDGSDIDIQSAGRDAQRYKVFYKENGGNVLIGDFLRVLKAGAR